MRIAKESGVDVPVFDLSSNGQLFVMERFDTSGGNQFLGFEDGCVLQGLPPKEKYNGSYERLVKSIEQFVSSDNIRESLKQFYTSLVVSWAVQNGDAHLKNFG